MATNPFDNLRINAGSAQRSQAWYRTQVGKLQNLQRTVDSSISQARLITRPDIGKLYLFHYDPKHKDTLPYYDTMPLVFPFERAQGGFLGLNLHYLPYVMRFKLMSALLDIAAKAGASRKTAFSWQLLSNSSRFPGAQVAVKHYLTAQMQSSFLEIPDDQWLAASQMPIERFVKTNKEAVFRDTRRMTR
jgi:hypothetical protein